MLGIGETHIVEPLSMPLRDAPPPLPTGTIEAEEVPEAVRPQPVPLVRLLLPIVMIAAMLGMVALMVLGAGDSRHISPVSLMFPLMMLASMAMMFGPHNSGQDPDETRRTYLRHIKALRERRWIMPVRSVRTSCTGIRIRRGWNRWWDRGACGSVGLMIRMPWRCAWALGPPRCARPSTCLILVRPRTWTRSVR